MIARHTRKLIGLTLLLVVVAFACVAQEEPINLTPKVNDIYLLIENDWAPLAFTDHDGKPQGLIVDTWQLIGQKTQRAVHIELLDRQHITRRMRASPQFILGGLLKPELNNQELAFSDPLFRLRTAIFINNKKLPTIIAPEDLTHTKLGVTAGSYEEEYLQTHYQQQLLQYFANSKQMIEAAVSGEIDAFVADYPVGMYYLDTFTTPDHFRVLSVIYSRNIQAAVIKSNKAALTDINQSLAVLNTDDLARLTQKWIHHQAVEVFPIWLAIILATLLILFIIAVLALHNKRLALKISQQAEELLDQQNQLLLLTTNMSDWVWRVDNQQKYIYSSPSIKKILGYDASELIGQDMGFILHPQDRERAYVHFQHQLSASKRGEILSHRDSTARFGLQHKDGHLVWTEAAVRIFFTPLGEFAGAQGSSRNINERKQAEDAIRQLAFNDPLTQLPNRRLLNDRLQQTMAASARNGQYAAVLFLDLDNFKYINDNYGHDCGDQLLQQIALRLVSGVRDSDTLARFGGDEFTIISEHLSANFESAKNQALIIGLKILDLFDKEFVLQDVHCTITTSIGIALFNDDSKSPKALIKYADAAMYQAKAQGRNRCVVSEYNSGA